MTQLRKQMQDELLRRNYSESTIRTYLHSVEEFAKHFGKRPDQLGAAHISAMQKAYKVPRPTPHAIWQSSDSPR